MDKHVLLAEMEGVAYQAKMKEFIDRSNALNDLGDLAKRAKLQAI